MCKAFSCIVNRASEVTWQFGVDSHTELVRLAKYPDNTADPAQMVFARVEITPDNGSYLEPSSWTLRVDESIIPTWFGELHRVVCFSAHKKWLAKLDKILVHKPIVHPFKLKPPKVTNDHVKLLAMWDSVRDSVWASVGDSVWASVRDSVGASVGDSVWASVRDSVGDSVGASVGDSVWASVRDSVGASVRDSVRASVWASVRDSVWAYAGSFLLLSKWKGVKHHRGKYPFQSAVDLWNMGLVPSFDGTTWRLHGGPKGGILYEILASELTKCLS